MEKITLVQSELKTIEILRNENNTRSKEVVEMKGTKYKFVILGLLFLCLFIGSVGCSKTSQKKEKIENFNLKNIGDAGYIIKINYKADQEMQDSDRLNPIDSIGEGNSDGIIMTEAKINPTYKKLEDIHTQQLMDISLEVLTNEAYEQGPIITRCKDGYLVGLSRKTYKSYSMTDVDKKKLIPIIYKFDFEGNILWKKEYKPFINGGSITNIFDYANGDFGFTLTKYPHTSLGYFGVYGENEKAKLVRCDSSGKLIWSKEFDDYCGNLFKFAFVNAEQHLITVGEIEENPTALYSSTIKPMDIDVIVMELDEKGEMVQRKVFGGDYIDYIQGADFDLDHGIVITGWSSPIEFTDELYYKTKYMTHDKSCFIVENESVDRSYYDYIALINNDFELQWLRNSKENERFNYNQLVVNQNYVNIPGSKRFFDTSISNDFSQFQKTFWQQYDFDGNLLTNKYVEELLVGPELLCVTINNNVVLASGNRDSGWLYLFDEQGEELGMTTLAYEPRTIVATDDGGVTIKAIRAIKTLPQPVFASSIWSDTEVVLERFDENLKLVWRKTYNDYPDTTQEDHVYPLIESRN